MPDEPLSRKDGKKFYPDFLFEISVVALFAVETVLILAVLFPSAPGREIDLSAPFQPRPEWYFLFLYQLTKYFPGRWTFLGAVLLPAIAFGLLLLAPFLDGGSARRLRDRKAAAAGGFLLLAAVVLLTALSQV